MNDKSEKRQETKERKKIKGVLVGNKQMKMIKRKVKM